MNDLSMWTISASKALYSPHHRYLKWRVEHLEVKISWTTGTTIKKQKKKS
jgi:hypothetical protein